MFVPRYTEQEARDAVASSFCYAHALRKLGLRPVGGNHRVFRKYVDEIWRIPTGHFDAERVRLMVARRQRPLPLADVLVEHSTYSRAKLKERLYESGLKSRKCELCGQGEEWRGMRMSLILDHVNGAPNDNRLENLRIVCPNCAATLDTHCGRKNRLTLDLRRCRLCGRMFLPPRPQQRYCSVECGCRHDHRDRSPKPERRKVPRPPYEQLIADVASLSMVAVGRKYGVSDNAVRKWIRWYQYQRGPEQSRTTDGHPAEDELAA
jgi:hypothetical protein